MFVFFPILEGRGEPGGKGRGEERGGRGN